MLLGQGLLIFSFSYSAHIKIDTLINLSHYAICACALTHANHDKSTTWIWVVGDNEITFRLLLFVLLVISLTMSVVCFTVFSSSLKRHSVLSLIVYEIYCFYNR